MPAPAFASAPFREPVMQADVSPAYGEKQSVYGPLVLRPVEMHFEMHLVFAPTNFASVPPVLDSHFATVLVGCASTDVASRHRPLAATAAFPNHPTITLPLLF